MPNSIKRKILPLSDGGQLQISLYNEADEREDLPPLLICLHPGWEGRVPDPHYGEQFLSSIFIPAFAETGAALVAPDCPDSSWNTPKSKKAILSLLDHLIDRSEINPNQVSLVGYSAGGWGAWYLLLDSTERFSSAVMFACLPVMDPADNLFDNFAKGEELVNSGLDEWTRKLPAIPIYMIHSTEDELFPHHYARLVFQALLDDLRQVYFESVEGVGHFNGSGYITPLRNSIPWLLDTWKTQQHR